MMARKDKKCDGCGKTVGKSFMGSMALNKKNYPVLQKSHADFCFDCAMLNDAGKAVPFARETGIWTTPKPGPSEVKHIDKNYMEGDHMAIHSLDVVNEVPKLFPFPNVLARTDSMDYLDWLKARKQGIGGSVMAALFGMSPWGTPASVYFELTEEMPARDESEIMEMGHIMEPVIADVFQQKTGKRVTRAPFLFQHPEEPWLIGNIDFALVDEDAGLECKNAGEYKREEFEDGEVPDYYFIQCQHYMAVTGKSKWYLAAIIGGNKFRYFEIPRDEGIIEAIRKKAREFWNDHILPRKMPALDGHTATTSAVKMLYGAENGETVDLLESIDDMFEELLRLKASAKELAGEIDRIENEIKVAIGDATLGITPAGRKIKYTTVNVGEKVVNAYSFRRLWLPKK